MNTDEPKKELKPAELLTAMIGKTIKTVNSTDVDHLNIEFTDGTEVELKAENFCYVGDPAIIAYEPIYLNSRDIANMPLEKDWKSLEGIVITPEKKSSSLHRPFFKIDPQSNFSQPSD